jgi:hypothetical protein
MLFYNPLRTFKVMRHAQSDLLASHIEPMMPLPQSSNLATLTRNASSIPSCELGTDDETT